MHFNPRPPRGGRPYGLVRSRKGGMISIHAPREGGDVYGEVNNPPYEAISIHAPREGGDLYRENCYPYTLISIHAPREGGDPGGMCRRWSQLIYFNPRPPRGGRRGHAASYQCRRTISIHAPREGGDGIIEQERFYVLAISIHAPREGGDNSTGHPGENKCDFNPRPPRGGRLFGLRSPLRVRLFQSTPPARGATTLADVI